MSSDNLFRNIKDKAQALKRETMALYFAYQDVRTPWYARAWAVVVVGYALSPIDLIPDFIPVLGLLDDLVLVPLGITLALRMIPREVMADARDKAAHAGLDNRTSYVAAGVVVAVWLAVIWAIVWAFFR